MARLALGVVSVALASASVHAGARAWTAVAVGGDVRHETDPIAPGQVLDVAPSIETGGDGRLALLSEDEIIVLDPETSIDIVPSSSPLRSLRTHQRTGGVFYSMSVEADRALTVQTPNCSVAVSSGSLLVTAQRGYSTVHVQSGIARVASRDWLEAIELRAGDTLLARLGGRPRIVRSGADPGALGRRWGRRIERQLQRYSRMTNETSHVRSVVRAARRNRETIAERPAAQPAGLPSLPRADDDERAVHPLTQAEFAKQFMSAFFEESLDEIDPRPDRGD